MDDLAIYCCFSADCRCFFRLVVILLQLDEKCVGKLYIADLVSIVEAIIIGLYFPLKSSQTNSIALKRGKQVSVSRYEAIHIQQVHKS